jgi:hypothetical protein
LAVFKRLLGEKGLIAGPEPAINKKAADWLIVSGFFRIDIQS